MCWILYNYVSMFMHVWIIIIPWISLIFYFWITQIFPCKTCPWISKDSKKFPHIFLDSLIKHRLKKYVNQGFFKSSPCLCMEKPSLAEGYTMHYILNTTQHTTNTSHHMPHTTYTTHHISYITHNTPYTTYHILHTTHHIPNTIHNMGSIKIIVKRTPN